MKAERLGWILSAVLHGGIVVVAVVGLPHLGRERPSPPPPVAVDFVKIDDVTRVVEPEPEQELPPTPVEQRPAETARAPEPAVDAEAVPLPKAAAAPAPKPAAPKPKPKPDLTDTQKLSKRIRPSTKPKPPSRLKADRLAALINKELKEEQEQVRQTADEAPKAEQQAPEPTDRFANIRGRLATATLQEALRQRLESCWNIPVGAKGIENMFVKVRIYLRPDGTLSRQPEFVSPIDLNDNYQRTFAESARTAVYRCAPFEEARDYILEGNPFIDFDFDGSGFAG